MSSTRSPRIHNSRSAADIKRTSAHNDGVTAIAWSLVGLMAASLGVLATALFAGMSDLGARIDGMGARLDARIDAVGSRLDGRMDSLGSELRTEMRDLRSETHELGERLIRIGG